MKITFRLLSFMIFILLFQTSYAQKYDCGWYGKKTVEERNKIFPFNKAKKVVLISYLGRMDGLLKKDDNRDFNEANGIIKTLKIHLDSLEVSYEVKEEISLDKKGINELSNILVNYTLKKEPTGTLLMSGMACYVPRNSILFLDENDTVICNFEICFQCLQTNIYPYSEINAYSQIEECFPRFELLKKLFRNNGIRYGVEDN